MLRLSETVIRIWWILTSVVLLLVPFVGVDLSRPMDAQAVVLVLLSLFVGLLLLYVGVFRWERWKRWKRQGP